MTPALLRALQDARQAKRQVVLATRLPDGEQLLLPDGGAAPGLAEAAAAALRDDSSRTVEIGGQSWFLHAYNPPMRLVVVGAVHIAQALVPFAAQLGFGVCVVDPRRAFATDERFPDVEVRQDWPDEAMDALRPDARTAVVTLTHDPKLDDPALDRALRSDAFYVGALGSRKTHAARLARLRELGHDDAALARIRGPVGLPLAAVTAPEIALSIAAEIVASAARGGPRCQTRFRETRRVIFGELGLEAAEGAVLAHTIRLPGRVLKKGSVLDAPALDALRAANVSTIVAARLEPGDIDENAAASRLADALIATGPTAHPGRHRARQPDRRAVWPAGGGHRYGGPHQSSQRGIDARHPARLVGGRRR